MADSNNNNQEIMKNNETPKKHSYFWWKINKDLLDFRYNTQEEIDKLNEKMTITNDLDEIIKQTSNLPENKDTDEQENYDELKKRAREQAQRIIYLYLSAVLEIEEPAQAEEKSFLQKLISPEKFKMELK